ncbi:MAG: DUF4124 domain-containing protein [Uliginosibacterium sp.]|jgi:hypothetical protein|nr:DUF4124 domain-containing protein [Uliginosibacterium sp.]MBK9395117.1 DUF4124 domain-containing protein [Uliginosibacterium sp.]MBK9614979.1 DUF4124 domain-containing protein [Uliginosibacterium sp.]
MTKLRYFSLLLLVFAASVQADIFKCVDDAGHTTYTNDKPGNVAKGCTLMSREQPVSTVSSPTPRKGGGASANPTPSTFPKVDDSMQRSRDGDRRKILEQELSNEEKLLEAARKTLAEQEAQRLGDEKNYQKYLDRVQQYKDSVQLHERNIEAIRKEIANLK